MLYVDVRTIFRQREYVCHLDTSATLKLFLRYSHSMFKIYHVLTVYSVLKPPPILFAVSKLYHWKLFKCVLISFAMSQRSNI